ncbi:MAG TPA: hypothetical protein VHA56_07425 [Mucilaginibacter sp.]|nr:hypothetical protein [Mucilaginibacter sp.]
MREKVIEFFKNNAPVSLTLLSAYGYFCVYVYEYGYFKYFNLPADFIEVQLNEVLIFIFSLTLLICGVIFWIDKLLVINTSYGTRKFLVNTTIKTFGLGLIVFFLVLNVSSFSSLVNLILLGVIIVLCIAFIIWEYLFVRKCRKLWTFLEEDILKHAEEILKKKPSIDREELLKEVQSTMLPQIRKPTKSDPIKSRKPFSMFADFMILSFTISLICFGRGYYDAAKLKSFIGFKKHPTVFVLKKYGDNMICKKFDFANKIFGDSIVIYKMSDTSNNVMIENRIR